MELSGQFYWFESLRLGGRKAISFVLRNDNLLRDEVFDCAIVDGSGQTQPQIRRQLVLKPRQEFKFDYDTCDWDWCPGDYFAILGAKGKVKERWDCSPSVYAPGECPQCHGTHKCPQCGGNGFINDFSSHTVSSCMACHGTGCCQQCYIPTRQNSNGFSQQNTQQPNPQASKQRQIASLQRQIDDLQRKIEKTEFDIRMMQIRGTDLSSKHVYFSMLQLKSQYERQLINLQYQLQQLELIQ